MVSTSEDGKLINQAVQRAHQVAVSRGRKLSAATTLPLRMALEQFHLHGGGLRLAELAEADDDELVEDVFGIFRHLDPSTSQLRDDWQPRYIKADDETN